MMLAHVALLSRRRAYGAPYLSFGGLLSKHPIVPSMTGVPTSLQRSVGESFLSVYPPAGAIPTHLAATTFSRCLVEERARCARGDGRRA
jgi:hypothetical protein